MTTGGGGVHPGDPWHPDWRPGADEPEEIETGPGAAEEKKPAEPDLADAAEPFDPDAHLEVAPASEPTDEFPDFDFDLDSEAKAEPEVEPEVEPEAETETETEAEAEAEAGEIESASAETVEDALAELEASAARVEVSDEEATAEELVEQEPVAEEPVEPEAVEAETVEPEPVEPEPVEPEPVEMVSFEPDTSEAVIAFSATHAEAEAPAEEAAAAESEAAAVKETVEPGSEPDTEETTTRGWDVASGTAELDEEAAGLGYTGVIPAVAAQAIGDEPDKGLEEEPPSRETPDAETPDEDTLEPETPDAETPEPEPAEKAADVEPEKAGTKETEIEETGPTDIGADEIDEAARESLIDHDADTAEVPVVVAGEMESVTTETPVDSDSNADIDIADLQETPTSPGETPEGAAAIGDAPAVTDDPAEDEAWAEFMAADIDGVEAAELEVDEVDISDLQDDTAEHEFLVEDAETTAAQPELFGALGASASEAEELEADAPETDALATDSSKTETLEPESTEPAPSEPDSSRPETPGAEPSELESPETDSPETDSPETDSPELGESELPDESEVATAAQVEVVEETELTVEKEMVDALTSDIAPLEFEAFTTQELTEERYAPAPTQEHVGLAEAIAAAESREIEAEAMSAPLDGVDTGVLGVDEIAEDETFFLDDPDDDRDLDHDPDEESVEVDEDSPGAGGSELTLRIASAVLLVSVFGLSLSLGGVAFLVFIGAVSLVALTEFMDVSTESGYRPLRLFAWLGAIGILVGTYTNGPAAIPAGLAATAAVVLAWFGSRSEPPQEPYVSSVVTLFGVAWIPALLSFVLPIAESPNRIALVVSLMLIVAAFDVGSYFVGRALGKRKLAPEISPNKSVEGLIGGVVLALIVALVASVFVEPITALIAVYLAIGISIAAPLGDLSESLVKRHFGVKDMGDILPGHGGLLDRIDGYLFAVPVAYLILLWTGVI